MNATLINALQNGVAVFTFVKKNGELRKAIGTTNARIIAKVSPRTKVNDLVVADATNRYFDLECRQWRRVACGNFAEPILVGTMELADIDAIPERD